jgi:hypothetical protein
LRLTDLTAPKNRKDAVVRFALSVGEVLTLCLLFQLSACGGGGSISAVPPPVKPCIPNCTVEPFLATNNFALLETQPPYPAVYSTGAGADWNVLSWGQQPGVNWQPFVITNPSTTEEVDTASTLATAYDPMTVSFQRNTATGAWTSTTLGQTATTYCGSPIQEFDFFLQPNDQNIFVRTNPSGILSASGYPTGGIPTLQQITAIDFQGTVTVVAASRSTSSVECGVNQSDALVSLVLGSTTGQTIFYQLGLSSKCYPGTDAGAGCITGNPGEYFCGVSNPYCIGDPITSYGHSYLNPGDSITMNGINIAPRLKALISGGSPDGKMDTNPAHWQITAMYVGQSAWGQANLETSWSGEFLVQLTY